MDENVILEAGEAELLESFAGLFDEETAVDPKSHTTIEQEEETTTETAEEAVVEGEAEEAPEIDMGFFVPVKVGDEELEVTIEELSKSYTREKDYNNKVSILTAKAAEVLEMEKRAMVGLELSKLECDLILEDAARVDMNSLSPEEFKDMSLKKNRLKEKSAAIKARLEEMKPRHEAIAREEKIAKARNAFSTLQREVPGFNIDMYNSALAHAVSVLGVDRSFAENCTDAGVLKALISANENYVSPSRLKKTRMPVKTTKVTPVVAKAVDYSREEDLLALGESLF